MAPGVELIKWEEGERITVPAATEQDLEMLFRRVNNAFIHRLTLSFHRMDLALPYYLRTNADELQCHVRILRIEGVAEAIDAALVDFLGVQMKPKVYETQMWNLHEDYIMLFTHDALRGSIAHLAYEVSRSVGVVSQVFLRKWASFSPFSVTIIVVGRLRVIR